MVPYLGDYDATETVVIPFNTFTSDDPSASVTITNFANTDVHIFNFSGDALVQRTSAAGVTIDIDTDTYVGAHLIAIDLTDNTDTGFYSAGSRYQVLIEGTTVDAATVTAWVGTFKIRSTSEANMEAAYLGVTKGIVDDTVAPTTTTFESDTITEATADHFNGSIVKFTTGALIGQAAQISDYELSGGRGKFTVTTLTEAPSDLDEFVIF